MRPEAKIAIAVWLAKTIEQDATYCNGRYSSGYMAARYHLGSEIRKAYTMCADGGRNFAFYYSVVALPSGAIVRFGSGGVFAQEANPETAPRAERLEDAALRSLAAPKQ